MNGHQGIEPTADQFMLCLSDGKHTSAHVPFYVIINPINDEVPEFLARNITVGSDWVTQSAGMNCTQETVDTNLLRYLHMGPHRTSLCSTCWTGRTAPHHSTATSPSRTWRKAVKTSCGERVVLTTGVLLATDGTDKPEELLYMVTVAPGNDHGIHQTPRVGHQHLQPDGHRCQPGGLRPRQQSHYIFNRFVVSNSKATRNGTLVLPSLACNGGLRVPQDSSMAVTSEAPPSDLLFFLAQPPQYCTLLRGGVPLTAGGSNFTQWDLQELEVTYRHGGGPSQIGLRHYQQGLPAGGEGTD
ncbi:hypothetical protein J4Q44_G00055200 [Coregonus suidteri]|uniref:Uncharacterized protein n=1 Tax=Coregonus suidteri TaxID=861788 RepID=A0AAN8R382_9TELE